MHLFIKNRHLQRQKAMCCTDLVLPGSFALHLHTRTCGRCSEAKYIKEQSFKMAQTSRDTLYHAFFFFFVTVLFNSLLM